MTIKDDLNAAIAQDQADSAQVIAVLTAFTTTVADLVAKLDAATAAETISADEVRGIITQLNAEHDAVVAALAANPPAPATGTGSASV